MRERLVELGLIAALAFASSASAQTPLPQGKDNAKTPLQRAMSDPRAAVAPPAGVEARGDVIACLANPNFLPSIKGFGAGAYFSTSNRFLKGLVLEEKGQTALRTYQHPSWTKFGWLAGIHFDDKGNIYTVPAPRINILDNEPSDQNRVLKVDTNSGEMTVFAQLPNTAVTANAYEQNPYGALGIAFDCESRLLYVSSLAGSTRSKVAGRIYAIETTTGKIRATLSNVDAIGLHIHKRAGQKRLYFGSMRDPEIWSVEIDGEGGFKGDSRFEFSLEGMGPRGDDRARKIAFTPLNEMFVTGIEFSVNLVAPTEKQESIYRFLYDSKLKQWVRKKDFPQQP
jgi:hypothetical protein